MTHAIASPIGGMLADSPTFPTNEICVSIRLPRMPKVQAHRGMAKTLGFFDSFASQTFNSQSFVLLFGNLLVAMLLSSLLQDRISFVAFM